MPSLPATNCQQAFKGTFFAYITLLTIASLIPGSDLPSVSYNDKIAHVAGYFLLGVLGSFVSRRPAMFYLLFVYGVAIEGLQGLSGQREPSILDAIANAFGLCLAWLAANRYWRHRSNLL